VGHDDICHADSAAADGDERFLLVESAPVGIYLSDPEGRYTYVNRRWCEIAGITVADALGDGWLRTVLEPDRERVRSAWVEAVGASRGYSQEYRLYDREGAMRWVSCSAVLLAGETVPGGYVGTCIDITEHKRTEDALRGSEARFRTVADFTYDWEYWAAPDGSLLYVSPSCERITGHPAERFLDESDLLASIVHADDRQLFAAHTAAEREGGGKPQGITFRVVTRDGRTRWIGHECQHVHASDGTYLGIRGSNRDITDRKEAEDALHAADKLRASLLSSVSHQLKTPLAALEATVTNMLERDIRWDEASVRSELTSALNDIGRLGASIGALLDVSRLEAHVWTPRPDWHDFQDILDTAGAALPYADRGRVAVSLPADLSPVWIDYEQGVRLFQNLLENAVVYGGWEPAVVVGARREPGRMTVWVEDDGPGIPEQERELVFEKFYRTAEGARVPSGTGLGLAISREIVAGHNGTIHAEGVHPHGTRMVVDLPQPPLESDHEEEA
jgi:PAS domain S-box-containing protein